jgi:hypothetical protein
MCKNEVTWSVIGQRSSQGTATHAVSRLCLTAVRRATGAAVQSCKGFHDQRSEGMGNFEVWWMGNPSQPYDPAEHQCIDIHYRP